MAGKIKDGFLIDVNRRKPGVEIENAVKPQPSLRKGYMQ